MPFVCFAVRMSIVAYLWITYGWQAGALCLVAMAEFKFKPYEAEWRI